MMPRRTAIVSLIVFLLARPVAVQPARLGAAEKDARPAAQATPLKFRRVYVPQDHVQEVVGSQAYISRKRTEFERLVKRLEASPAGTAAGATIVRAEYSARLDRGGLLRGDAQLAVLHTAAGAVAMPLDPCRLAIGKPRWLLPEPREAQVVRTPDGRQVVLVEQSSTLQFPWTLRGQADPAGGWEFDLRLPACATTQLMLALPPGLMPQLDGAAASISDRPDEPAAAAGPTRSWTIQLGGPSRATLRLVPNLAGPRQRSVTLVREALTYNLAPSAVSLTAEFQLDVDGVPLSELQLEIDPGLQLIAAHLGDTPIDWRYDPAAKKDHPRVLFDLPAAILGTGRVVRLRALAPITLAKPWKLPRLRLLQGLWQEGKTTLLIPHPLSLQKLSPSHCRLAKVGPLPSPSVGESIQLQQISPQAEAELVVDKVPARIQITSGTTNTLGAGGMTAELRADCRALQGERYLVQMDFPRPWVIESVEAAVAQPGQADQDNLLAWDVVPGGPARGLLQIQLRRAIRANRRVRLAVRAHRRLPRPGERMGIEQLRFGRFRQVASVRHLVCVQAVAPLRLKFFGDSGLARLDRRKLDQAEQELIEAGPGALLFAADAAADRLTVVVQRARARYAAQIAVSAVLQADQLVQSYRIHCVPDSSPISRLLVHLSPAKDGQLDWSVDAESERALAARRLTEEERQQEQLEVEEGELWEILLRRQRETPFTLVGQRSTQLRDRQTIALAWLPGAKRQTGTLQVSSAEGTAIWIDPGKLDPISARPLPANRYTTTRGMFRYDPDEPTVVSVGYASGADRQPAAWAWSCVVASRFGQNGALHVANYQLQNTGRPNVVIRMPPGTTVREIRVDKRPVELPPAVDSRSAVDLPLPSRVRFPAVRITYTDQQTAPDLRGALFAPVPEIDVPVLNRRWIAWLPPGYALWSPSAPPPGLSGSGLAISRRLFGPLGGRPSDGPDRRWAKAGWQRLWSGGLKPPVPNPAVERFSRSLSEKARALQAEKAGRSVTWGELLGRYGQTSARAPRRSLPALLVDRWAMSQRGITPRTVFAGPSTRLTGNQDALARLRRRGLALLVGQDALLLTSSAAVARLRDALPGIVEEGVALLDRETFMEQRLAAPGRYVAADRWVAQPVWAHPPWGPTAFDWSRQLAAAGWTAHEVEIGGAGPARIEVYRPRTIRAIGWAALLPVAALVWWMTLRSLGRIIPLVGAAGVAALLVPEPLTPITSGVFLGVLLAGVLALVRSRRRSPEAAARGGPAAAPGAAAATGVLLVALAMLGALAAGAAFGSEGERPKAEQPVKVYPVVIPVDEQRRPTGELVFLPRPLYDALLQRDAARSVAAQGWLLYSANYHGVLKWDAVGARLEVSEFAARYNVEVLAEGTRVTLPLERGQIHLAPDQTKLDGRAVQADWRPDGLGLELDVPQPGRHQLELGFLPTTHVQDDTSRLKFSIPRVLRSQLKLEAPEDAEGIEFPSSLGSVASGAEPGLFVVDLGPVEELAVRWPVARPPKPPAGGVSVEQLLWLKVGPGSVSVDAELTFGVPQGRELAELRLALDPGWVMRLQETEQVGKLVSSLEGSTQTIRIPLKRPISGGQLTIRPTLILSGTSGVGRLRLPKFEPVADLPAPRLLAVSVSPRLQYEVVQAGEAEPVAVERFLDRWRDQLGAGEPQMIFRLPARGRRSWTLATRPVEPLTVADERLALSVGAKAIALDYQCRMTTSRGYHLQHRLVAPSSLQIQRVALMQNDDPRPIRWSQAGRIITMFLEESVTGEQLLVLRGSIPLRGRRTLAMPDVACTTAQVRSTSIEVYRQADVRVALRKVAGFSSVENAPLHSYKEGLGRLVASFRAVGESSARAKRRAMLDISPNRPRVECVQITRIDRVDRAWTAEVTSRLRVDRGVVDALRLDVPQRFGEPFEVEPAARLEIRDVLGQPRRRLVIRPPAPIAGEYEIRVRGVLSGQPLRAPDIVPLDLRRAKRYLLLPAKSQTEKIQWDVTGAVKAELPEPFSVGQGAAPAYQTYRIVRPTFRAVIQEFRQAAGAPQVRLADVYLAWHSDGRCHGVARFDLEPAGRRHCTLRLPATYQLVHVSVGGLPALLEAQGTGHWRLALGPAQLPQRIAVVFTGRLRVAGAAARDERLFEAPELVGVPVVQTLWTLYAPGGAGTGRSSGAASPVDGLEHDLRRYKTTAELIERAENRVKERPPAETQHWYRRWARRWRSVRARINEWRAAAANGRRVDAGQIKSIERRQAALAARLGTTQILKQLAGEAPAAADPIEAWKGSLAGQSVVPTRLESLRTAGPVKVAYAPRSAGDLAVRAGCAIGFAGCWALVWLLWRCGLLADWLAQWPYACGVLIGLAWWLWLTPGIVGLAILLGSALGSLRPNWTVLAGRA